MLGPDFPLPVNLERICRQGIFFFSFRWSKNAEAIIGKVARNSRTAEWVGYSKWVYTAYSFHSHSILLKTNKQITNKTTKNWEEPGWREGWGGEENVRAGPWLFLISFHSVEICQNQGEEKKREHWNLREREDVCEKFHKMCFHFKVFCAETTATFAWVLLLIFQSFFCALRVNRLRPKQSKCFSELCYPGSNSRKPSGNETWGSTSALL